MENSIRDHIRNLRPVIDNQYKWVCIGNAKTAQKSIMLGPLEKRGLIYRRSRSYWKKKWYEMYEENLDHMFIFTFVRNPWDRVVSAFHFLQKRREISMKERFNKYVKHTLSHQWPNVNRHFREQTETEVI